MVLPTALGLRYFEGDDNEPWACGTTRFARTTLVSPIVFSAAVVFVGVVLWWNRD